MCYPAISPHPKPMPMVAVAAATVVGVKVVAAAAVEAEAAAAAMAAAAAVVTTMAIPEMIAPMMVSWETMGSTVTIRKRRGDDDGTPDQGSGDALGTTPPTDDDGTPDQGSGDN
jgi:hypothetical protein